MKSIITSFKSIVLALILIIGFHVVSAQSYFESATGDGVINFAQNSGGTSQVKLSLSTSALSYQYNYVGGNLTMLNKWLYNFQVSAKPDNNSLATFVKSGQLQPGFAINGAIGRRYRLSDVPFSSIDIYVKPEYSFNSYDIYDTTRININQDPVFKARKSTYGGNLVLNMVWFPRTLNIYLGTQLGWLKSDNIEYLADGNVQTITSYPGTSNKILATDIKAVKKGQLMDVNKMPLKLDLIIDPNLKVSSSPSNTMTIGFMCYYRTDVKIAEPINRIGAGLCFLDATNPSKIYTSLGFEFPTWGKGVTEDAQKNNKGLLFATIGYTIK